MKVIAASLTSPPSPRRLRSAKPVFDVAPTQADVPVVSEPSSSEAEHAVPSTESLMVLEHSDVSSAPREPPSPSEKSAESSSGLSILGSIPVSQPEITSPVQEGAIPSCIVSYAVRSEFLDKMLRRPLSQHSPQAVVVEDEGNLPMRLDFSVATREVRKQVRSFEDRRACWYDENSAFRPVVWAPAVPAAFLEERPPLLFQ